MILIEAKGVQQSGRPLFLREETYMKKIDIGAGGIKVSAMGIGCMRISNLTVGDVSALVNSVLDMGIDLFDHADIYGDGTCEDLFGKMFAETPSLRSKMILQSKCGIRKGSYDLSKKYILGAVDGILQRLQTDCLDILLLHRPDSLMEPEEIAEAFDILHKAGKARSFGVSNMNPNQIELLQAYTNQRLVANQMQFSVACSGMVDSGINVNVPNKNGDSRDESILEYCRLKKITIQTWSPLQYGFFDGVFLGNEKYPELNAKLNELAEKYSVEPATIAIAWILRHPAKMQVISGSTNAERIAQMARASDIELSREEWYEIYRAAGKMLP